MDYSEHVENAQNSGHLTQNAIKEIKIEIDKIIYKIYGLSEEEIAIVENYA